MNSCTPLRGSPSSGVDATRILYGIPDYIPMAILLCLASAAAVAQPDVTVTGSRISTAQDEIAGNVTVLRRDEFDIEKPTELADLLRRVAGVHVDTVGARGGTGSIYIRGADPNYTLVLLNGVRVNDPTNSRGGSFDLSALDVADVERIEIARGPYSAIYGGDALAGVINIITRPDSVAASALSLDAIGGAYDTSQVSLRAAVPTQDGRWYVGLTDAEEGELVRGNRFEAQRISAGFDTRFGEATDLSVSARHSQSTRRAFPDDSGGYEYAVLRDTDVRDARESQFGVGLAHAAGEATIALALGYFDRDERVESPGVAPGLRDPFGIPPSAVDTDFTRYTATLTATHPLTRTVTVAYGLDWQREAGDSDGELDFGGGSLVPTSFELTRSSWAPFAEMRVESAMGLSAQAGARVDMPEDESSVTSPRLRVAYELPVDMRIAASWGKAFKLPSLYALGNPLVGNPELAPERSESYEIELSQTLPSAAARWSVTWFDNQFRNAIDFDSGPPPQLVNRNRVESRGFELSGRLGVGESWSFDAGVTHAHTRITATDGELRNRPDWSASFGAHWAATQALAFSLAATHTGSTFDSSIPTGDVRLGAFTRIDLSAAWQLTPRVQAYLAIDNLTDEHYQQFVGFESRGIVPQAGVRLTL